MDEYPLNTKQSDEHQYVVFKLGQEIFGLIINKVKEIIVYQDTTKLPGTRKEIEGVINLRGNIIPVYDLRKKFSLPALEGNPNTRIVVVEVHNSTIGIIVDGVSEVLMIPDKLIEQPSSIIASDIDGNYITGIAKMENGMVIILNLDKAISPDSVREN